MFDSARLRVAAGAIPPSSDVWPWRFILLRARHADVLERRSVSLDGGIRQDDRPARDCSDMIVLLGDRLELDRPPHRDVEISADRDHAVVGEEAAVPPLERL